MMYQIHIMANPAPLENLINRLKYEFNNRVNTSEPLNTFLSHKYNATEAEKMLELLNTCECCDRHQTNRAENLHDKYTIHKELCTYCDWEQTHHSRCQCDKNGCACWCRTLGRHLQEAFRKDVM